MTTHIVTANRLDDGAVVYLGAEDRWTETVGCARVAADDAGLEVLLAAAARAEAAGLVVTPYAVPVSVEGGAVRPRHIKERIRAEGPTTRPDLGKQANGCPAAA
jgi:sulfite reductase (NADPH) hemoprotein beta-component